MTTTTHTVHTDATPTLLSGWKIESHQGMGELRLELRNGKLFANDREVTRYLSEQQKTGYIRGHDLQQQLAGRPVLNATVLDYLLAHPELIPESWKRGYTYFWGTIYRDSGACGRVRCLVWVGGGWAWGYLWLGFRWGSGEPAAVLAA